MSKISTDDFIKTINDGYVSKPSDILLGVGALNNDTVFKESIIRAPLSMMNRHGLIAGATGTGKTKSLQRMLEKLSEQGVPCLALDIKGDLSGVSQSGVMNDKIKARQDTTGLDWSPKSYPTEFFTLSNDGGIPLRATVGSFGALLFSSMLSLNDTQGSMIAIIFKWVEDNNIPLITLGDMRDILSFVGTDGKDDIEKVYGAINTTSLATIQRKVIELETQGADNFFGEPTFDISDFIRQDSSGKGIISLIRVADMITKPKLFSAFMLYLLTTMYRVLPELGDVVKPKLCFFIDEAHLLFDEASNELLDTIEQTIKLIRSKGVGIYFITQNPTDIPASVLSQLGMKIQHALRAFTANDNKAIKLAADNFPMTDFYNVPETLTSLGVGEALVTALNERGNPTPLVYTILQTPETRMDTITNEELMSNVKSSVLFNKYSSTKATKNAKEELTKFTNNESTINDNQSANSQKEEPKAKEQDNILESMSKNTMVRQIGRAVTSEVTRTILGMFGLGGKRRK
jgi:uncharacterized protein